MCLTQEISAVADSVVLRKTSQVRRKDSGQQLVMRTMTHPRVMAALATEDLSESYGRAICQWTGKLPEDCRPAADAS